MNPIDIERMMDDKTGIACACTYLSMAHEMLVQSAMLMGRINEVCKYGKEIWDISDRISEIIEDGRTAQRTIRKEITKKCLEANDNDS